MNHDVEVVGLSAARELLASNYSSARMSPSDAGPQGVGMSSSMLGAIRLDHLSLRMAFEADFDPPNALIIGHVQRGTGAFSVAGVERRYGAGDVCIVSQPSQGYHASIADTDSFGAMIDPVTFAQVADSALGRAETPTTFTGYDAISPLAAENWKRTFRYLWSAVRADSTAMTNPIVAGSAVRLLVATAIATFPNTAVVDPTYQDRRDSGTPTLRRAIAFIEASAEEDISVADIAFAACVTIRAVQLAFRRYLGTTPLGYLRQVRMQRAHEDLSSAIDGMTVTAVANRWGFYNSGRFASDYRNEFAKLPSQTLGGDRGPSAS